MTYSIVEDRQTAEECENATYMEAWNSIPPNRPKGYFYAYLARITRHIPLNRCRERSRLKRNGRLCELSAEMEQCLPSAVSSRPIGDDIAFADALNSFLGSISREKRNILLRRYWYAESISDIAHRFGYFESKIKAMLSRLRNQLKEHLEKKNFPL